MTPSYFAWVRLDGQLVPPPDPMVNALATRGLAPRWQRPSVTVFATTTMPLMQLAGDGLVIGHHFGKTAASDGPHRNPADPARLTKDCWGSYVAIGHDLQEIDVVRAPFGELGCYWSSDGSVCAMTSEPRLLIVAGLVSPAIDWSAIAGALARHAIRTDRTAIADIFELRSGCRLRTRSGSVTTDTVWEAAAYCNPAPGSFRDHAATVENVVLHTLAAWADVYSRPIVEISGGLDSAIVAAGLAQRSASATLVTFAAADGDHDELPYARAIADHLGLTLEVTRPSIEDVNLRLSLSRDLPRPNARAFTQAADLQSLAIAQSKGANAFFSGGGGDDVFCYVRSVLPAIDRLRAEGLPAALTSIGDIARMNHGTVWEALRLSLRRLATGPRPLASDGRLLTAECLELANPSGVASVDTDPTMPGKAAHMRGVMTIHNYLEGHARAVHAPIVSALISQPIVEACLAIPSWHWCHGGHNRAVARAAFARHLPAAVIDRRTKGAFDGFCAQLLHANRRLARDLLLGGALAQRGLLDVAAVDRALRHPSPAAETVSRLLAIIDVESWIGAWSDRRR